MAQPRLTVRLNEEAADAPSVPVPEIYHSWFSAANDIHIGQIYMSFLPDDALASRWDSLDDIAKERACLDIWTLID